MRPVTHAEIQARNEAFMDSAPANDNADPFAPLMAVMAEVDRTIAAANQLSDSIDEFNAETKRLIDSLIERGRPDLTPME